MSSSESSWCRHCQKIDFDKIFHVSSRARTRKLAISSYHVQQSRCPMCMWIRDVGRLYNEASVSAHGNRPEPSLSTGKLEYQLVSADRNSTWLDVVASGAGPGPYESLAKHAWLKLQRTSIDDSVEPAILVTIEDDTSAARSIPRIKSQQETVGAKVNIDMLKEWLKLTETSRASLPAVMDTSASQLPDEPRKILLIDVRSRTVIQADTTFRYFAMSYVWGSNLKQSDWLSSRPKSKKGSRGKANKIAKYLPDTLEDALTLLQDLAECYLWIDLFCIEQNDPDHFQAQIAGMHYIYACATCTIVAYDSEDVFSGIAGVSRPLRLRSQPIVHTPARGRLMATWLPGFDHSTSSSWDSRAWCFQEQYYSPRLLYFSETETALTGSGSVRLSDAVQPSIALHRAAREPRRIPQSGLDNYDYVLEWFNDLLTDYTSRFLSKAGDGLNAFRGVLSALAQTQEESFNYGLPIKDPHKALLWCVADEHVLTPRAGFPSWSWCGWLGPVRYRHCLFDLPRQRQSALEAASDRAIQSARLTFPERESYDVFDHTSHILKVQSPTAECRIRKTADRESCNYTYLDPDTGMARKQDLGYHWTLSNTHNDPLIDMANNPCWPDIFSRSSHWLRLSADEEAMLEPLSINSDSYDNKTAATAMRVNAKLVLIKRWEVLRDNRGKTLRNVVGCLLVVPAVREEDGEVLEGEEGSVNRRVAALFVEGATFEALGPEMARISVI
jgi:hypothetical protein